MTKPSHGIDVAALEAAADQVQSVVASEDLRLLAIRTRDAALAVDRARLDAKWTWWGSNPLPTIGPQCHGCAGAAGGNRSCRYGEGG